MIAGGGLASRVLWAWLPSGHPRVALVRPDLQGPHGPKAPFRVLVVHTQPQDTGAIRNTPRDLKQLADELDLCGVDLLALIKAEMVRGPELERRVARKTRHRVSHAIEAWPAS